MNENIVNRHGNTVLPYRVMLIHHDGEAQLCTDTVRTADENGLFNMAVHEREKAAEAAEITENFRTIRRLYGIFHQFDRPVARIDINAGGGIG